jgi:hypothetical protein
VQWRDMARATANVRSFWKFFHFVNQFPRPARKNGHPVLSSRFVSRVFVITISSHLNGVWRISHMLERMTPFNTDIPNCKINMLNLLNTTVMFNQWFNNECKGPVINYRGGGAGGKRGGIRHFCAWKKGGQKFLCNINTCPAWPCCTIKLTYT